MNHARYKCCRSRRSKEKTSVQNVPVNALVCIFGVLCCVLCERCMFGTSQGVPHMAVSTQQIDIFQLEKRLTASEYRVEKLQLFEKNCKKQIHLMEQRLVRAEAQILKNTDFSDALERAVDRVVTSVSLESQKDKPAEEAYLPVGTRRKKIVLQSEATRDLEDSPVIKNEICLFEVSGVEIALENTEVLEANGEKWTTVASKRKKTPRGCAVQVTTSEDASSRGP